MFRIPIYRIPLSCLRARVWDRRGERRERERESEREREVDHLGVAVITLNSPEIGTSQKS
jgi:hypothetical protein